MRGCSDTEILSWIASVGGTDAFLDQAFSCLSDAFDHQHAEPSSAVITWDIRTPDRGIIGYRIEAEHGAWRVERGEGCCPGVVCAVDMANFVRLLLGDLDGGDAVNAGTLQVSGDTALANEIRLWFQANPSRPQ